MAIYRPIHITFWQDKFIMNLTPEQKYFYLYLMTNSKTKQCGIYELPKGIICFETGYNLETINKLLHTFSEFGKIIYDENTEEIYIKNWIKFNQIDNRNIFICVCKELKEIKSKVLSLALAKSIENINLNTEYSKGIKEACKGLNRGLPIATKKETPTPTESEEESPSTIDWEVVKEKWNNLATAKNLNLLRVISESRKKKYRLRALETIFDLDEIITAISKQDFLLGKNDRNWKVDFDWLINNDENYLKVLEEKYSDNYNGKISEPTKFLNI